MHTHTGIGIYMHTNTYMHADIHKECKRGYIHTNACICTHTSTYKYTHQCTQIHTCIWTYTEHADMHTCTNARPYEHICLYKHAITHSHAHTQTHVYKKVHTHTRRRTFIHILTQADIFRHEFICKGKKESKRNQQQKYNVNKSNKMKERRS